ncbi:MAG: nucleoside monophosphate kinase [Planctomycetales bacterium]|nr:nucleoside monophosphate kinase [Planctomycetales bacterium]
MRKYIIIGVQGCGKGTQAHLLSESLDLVHISVGDIFRWHMENHTKLAARVRRTVAAGELVGDEVVEDIVRYRLDLHDWNYGFVLDGFPRNESQARFFLECYDINAVINIQVPDDVVRERVLARRLCSDCGLDYNLIYHRPEVRGTCDVCGGSLVSRPDDTEEALAKRLEDYHSKTEPVLKLFRKKELVVDIDGTPTPAEVQQSIRSALRLPAYTPSESVVGA